MNKTRSILRCLAAGLAAAPLGSALAASALFTPAPLVLKAPQTDAVYQALAARPSTHAMQLVTVDADRLGDQVDAVVLNLDFDGAFDVPLRRTSSYRSEDGSLVWLGSVEGADARSLAGPDEVASDSMNDAILVLHDGRVTGNVRVYGQLYAIRPLHDGRTAIVEVDESAMPPDHPPAAYRKLFDASTAPDLDATSPGAVTANSVIRVMVNYTPAVAAQVGDVAGLINLAVAESNQGYANSDVAITMQLATTSQVSYSETGNFDTDLTRYRGTSDGYMNSPSGWRSIPACRPIVSYILSQCSILSVPNSKQSRTTGSSERPGLVEWEKLSPKMIASPVLYSYSAISPVNFL